MTPRTAKTGVPDDAEQTPSPDWGLPEGVPFDPAPPPPVEMFCLCDAYDSRCRLCLEELCCLLLDEDDLCDRCRLRIVPSAARAMEEKSRKGKRP